MKVTFYDNANGKTSFTCRFRSLRLAERFIDTYIHAGGVCLFNYDLWGDDDVTLPTLPCNYNGFKTVYNKLYPELSI